MKGLKVVLWVCGIMLLVEFVEMLIPARLLASWCERFGIQMPLDAMSLYMMRMCQAIFGLVGVFLVILAQDPLKYRPMVLLAGYGSIFLGLVVLVAVVRYELPPWWGWAGTAALVVIGALILLFRGKAVNEQGAPQEQQGEPI